MVAISFDYLQGGQQMSLRMKDPFPDWPQFARRMFMRSTTLVAVTLLTGTALLAALPAFAQYPGQIKQNQSSQTLRAVAVLEWTGEEDHPKTSRLIPIAIYDGQQLQDAGIYLARPAPLALSSQVEYELKQNGKNTGLFVVNSAGQVQGAWVGFGAWKALPKPKPQAAEAKTDKDAWGNDNDDKPVLHRKHEDDTQSSGEKSGDSGANRSAPDPDRPTLHKKSSSDDSDSSGSSSIPAPDPDRPRLTKKVDKPEGTMDAMSDGSVESVKTLSDPERPKLTRGKPEGEGGDVLPTLMGLPPDMKQVVAISDAKDRPQHVWSFSWANPADEDKMKSEMEDLAREALGLTNEIPEAPAKAPKAKAASKRTSSARKKAAPPPPPPAPLVDEQFKVYELAYGGGATMVLSARTDGEGANQKFVTMICQPNIYGKATVLFKNVTDGAHLDITPRMRLVDAVDVMADNRGELLFELRGATQREFAIYRVLRGQVTKLFTSSPMSTTPMPTENADSDHS